ncbi:MAG: hypothetical protein ABGW66_02455 [Flavobacteriaceae bacterium]|jgi:hypothetical protein
MNKNHLILGAIALGFLFLLKPKINLVHAEHMPIENYIQPTSSNNTTNYQTFGASTLITVLD